MLTRSRLLVVAAVYVAISLVQIRCTPQQSQLVLGPLKPEDAVVDLRQDGGAPVRRGIPLRPSDWQKTPPCESEAGEVAINGACYIELRMRPPCGRTLEYGAGCYRPVAKLQREPSSVER